MLNRLDFVAVALLLAVSVDSAKPRLGFRLDDIQCGWMQANQRAIMDAFARYNTPLTVGVITGFGDCYAADLRARLARGDRLEVASHSVHHEPMHSLSYDQQVNEGRDSRNALMSLLPGVNVTTFILPDNNWDLTTVAALKAGGYSTMSAQCTVVQLREHSTDYLCTVNMYPTVSPVFFPIIDGMVHVDTGASTSTFGAGSQLLTPSQLFNGTVADCYGPGACSVATQLSAVPPFTNPAVGAWAVVMMHPQDFADGDVNTIRAFFDLVLPEANANFDVRALRDMPL